MASKDKTNKKINGSLSGRVVSKKLKNAATVLVERAVTHPFYKKIYKRSKKYLVHDNLDTVLGDVVEIIQIRPISKNKRFIISKVVGKDIEAVITEQLKEEAAEAIAEVMPEEDRDKGQVASINEELKTQNSKVKTATKKLKVNEKKGEK